MTDEVLEQHEQAPEKPRRRAARAFTVFAGTLALLVLSSCGAGWFLLFRSAGIPAGRTVEVEIPQGADTRVIANRLTNAGVVANANMFRLRARMDNADDRLKAGTYEFLTGMEYETVILRLEEGPPMMYVTLSVPEGFTIDQIAQRVQAKTGIPADEFKRVATKEADRFRGKHPFLRFNGTPTLEGYLFPKTYKVRKGAGAADVIGMMLDQFEKETAAVDLSYAASKNLTLHDVVTIASMIERETRLPRERPLVASVVYNRLRKGTYLEIDATVQYVLGNKPRLLYRDLRVESPYNTYLHKGLPPGPIANPGLESLEAAAHPADTGYVYYVLTGKNGSHTFATNQADFLRAKQHARGGLR